MQARKVKIQKGASGSNSSYSPWTKASFCFAKKLAIWCGKMDHFTTPDPPMLPPPPGTDIKWIQTYHHDKAEDKKRMHLLIEYKNICQLHLAYNTPLVPNLPLLLPKYDPTKPFPSVLPKYDPSMMTPISKF
eukprot:9316222-Ditylum_brightwellii.AAC.1